MAAWNSFRVHRAFYLYQPVHCTQWDSETVIWDVLDSGPCPGQVSDQMGLAQLAGLRPSLLLSVQVLQESREMPQSHSQFISQDLILITQPSLLCFPTNLDVYGDWLVIQIPLNGCYLKWLATLHVFKCDTSSYTLCSEPEGIMLWVDWHTHTVYAAVGVCVEENLWAKVKIFYSEPKHSNSVKVRYQVCVCLDKFCTSKLTVHWEIMVLCSK